MPPPTPVPLVALLAPAWPPSFGLGPDGGNGTVSDPGDDLTSNWSSLIGIITAIVGNMLIALALNVQRYAHIRLHRERQRSRQRMQQLKQKHGRNDGAGEHSVEAHNTQQADQTQNVAHETDPLLPRWPESRSKSTRTAADAPAADAPAADAPAADAYTGSSDAADAPASSSSDTTASVPDTTAPPTSYLRSPYWWLGQVLITIGEMGNFLAYGFAPASIVSPIGVVALISNCVVAPILFKESFRTRDFWGVVVAIGGVVTVVLSANQQETKLNPHDVWDAITTTAFEIYMSVTCALIALLMWASPRYGHRTILIDLGLVGLFGGYTVLATKGVSSMLSSTLFGAFITPMTYVLLFILLATAVMQVRYVNKALQRFDSTQVIPIQFVMFTLSVIVGSAVLYRDFERTSAEQAAKFVGGCLLTFFGVFIITSGRSPADVDDSDSDDDDERVEEADPVEDGVTVDDHTAATGEAMGLLGPQQTPSGTRRSSRRSSSARRSTRVNFAGRPYPAFPAFTADASTPSPRTPGAATEAASASSVAASVPLIAIPSSSPPSFDGYEGFFSRTAGGGDASEASPRQSTLRAATPPGPAADAPTGGSISLSSTLRPGMGVSAFSADSVLHAISAVGENSGTGAGGPNAGSTPPQADRPVTPATLLRATQQRHSYPHHTHHPSTTPPPQQLHAYYHQKNAPPPMISPSPLLSATVSAVMADTILKHMDGSSGLSLASGRRLSTRRVRPGLAASLFVPQDELLLDDAEQLLGLQAAAVPGRRDEA